MADLPSVTIWIDSKTRLSRISYYLHGLLELQRTKACELTIHGGLPKWARVSSREAGTDYLAFHLLGEVRRGSSRVARFAIDTSDSFTTLNRVLLNEVQKFYKVNCRYSWVSTEIPQELRERVSSIDPFFPLPVPSLAEMVFSLRVNPISSGLLRHRGIRALRERPTVDGFRNLRNVPKNCDIFLNIYAWPHNAEERNSLISRLKAMDIDFRGGFQPSDLARERFPDNLLLPPLNTRAYLQALASARLTLVVPGCHDCTPAKLPEQMAMGSTILMIPSGNTPDTKVRDGIEVAYVSPDLSDLEQRVHHLLAHEGERVKLAATAARTFDVSMQPTVVVQRMLSELIR